MFPHTKPPAGTQINPLHPLSRGLVGFWLFNEGSGSLANDISGNKNHGRLTNMAPNAQGSGWGGSKFGGGLDLDGVDDYVNCGNDGSLDITDAITISAWSKTIVNDGYWVTKNYATLTKVTPYMLTLRSAFAYEGFSFYDGNFHTTGITSSGTTKLIDGSWHNVTGTYDGLVLKFYIDGSLDSYLDYVGSLPVNTNDVLIGAAININEYHFNGSIDSVRIYNRALSVAEIKQLYKDPFCNMIKVPLSRYHVAVPPVGAIMNQFQSANIGADLYNGAIIV